MIEREECEGLSVRSQCQILELGRSSFYYEPVPVSPEDKVIMDLIDEIYTACPFYGARKISLDLKELGVPVGRKRTGSLMRLMGLEAVFPKRNTSKPHPDHPVYPYLLRGVQITRPDQVWSMDITYIKLKKGFVYLAAVIYLRAGTFCPGAYPTRSRLISAWKLSRKPFSTGLPRP